MSQSENLKNLTTEELKALIAQIQEELNSRQSPAQLVLYTHNCKSSAKYHLEKYKHWAKRVSSVDTTKTNGYAFVGDFLNTTSEHKLPVGAVIVEVCDTKISCYQMQPEGKQKIAEGRTTAMSSFIDEVDKLF